MLQRWKIVSFTLAGFLVGTTSGLFAQPTLDELEEQLSDYEVLTRKHSYDFKGTISYPYLEGNPYEESSGSIIADGLIYHSEFERVLSQGSPPNCSLVTLNSEEFLSFLVDGQEVEIVRYSGAKADGDFYRPPNSVRSPTKINFVNLYHAALGDQYHQNYTLFFLRQESSALETDIQYPDSESLVVRFRTVEFAERDTWAVIAEFSKIEEWYLPTEITVNTLSDTDRVIVTEYGLTEGNVPFPKTIDYSWLPAGQHTKYQFEISNPVLMETIDPKIFTREYLLERTGKRELLLKIKDGDEIKTLYANARTGVISPDIPEGAFTIPPQHFFDYTRQPERSTGLIPKEE